MHDDNQCGYGVIGLLWLQHGMDVTGPAMREQMGIAHDSNQKIELSPSFSSNEKLTHESFFVLIILLRSLVTYHKTSI
jgi:hypothetical protein